MSKNRIYICDDDDGIVDVTKIILEEKGYEVVSVKDTDFIIEEIINASPDLILLDLWMPNIGGEKIIQLLKSNPLTNKIPVIIVSASKDTEKISRISGAEGFITKPFDIADLENTVHKYLNA